MLSKKCLLLSRGMDRVYLLVSVGFQEVLHECIDPKHNIRPF